MFDNKYIADKLQTLGKLLEVNGAEESRIQEFKSGSQIVRRLEPLIGERLAAENSPALPEISHSLQKTIEDLYVTGISPLLEQLLEAIPAGVVKMLDLKGLGPKKARVIWRQMGIDNLGELYYACVENRLVEMKGFGLKTQEKVREAIDQLRAHEHQFLYATLHPHAIAVLELLQATFGEDVLIALTGEMRRNLPVVSRIELLCDPMLYKDIMLLLIRSQDYEIMTAGTDLLQVCVRNTRIHLDFLFRGIDFFRDLVETTGPEPHLRELQLEGGPIFHSEEEVYARTGLPFVPPELRDQPDILSRIQAAPLPRLIEYGDLKGILHAHSTWSDGLHTLEEMAMATRAMGLQYLGITDHSQSATAANGLSEARVEAQKAEIDRLNAMLHPFRILKGIEADIRPNGDLDYNNLTLAGFDFVIASVHTDLNMRPAPATQRILRAIRNPYTNILGHPTGRLLLAREGYSLDHRTIIDACAEHGVAIELNCSPHRMDLDWTWISYAVEKGVPIAINPDAHRKADLAHVELGIAAARKGMLTPEMTLNARDLAEIEEFFLQKRKYRIR
ncbi:MAG: PHP domain-containing protein [Bacteroidota bacterium]